MSEEESKYDVVDEVLVQDVLGEENSLVESKNWLVSNGFLEMYSADNEKTSVNLDGYRDNEWATIVRSRGFVRKFSYGSYRFRIHVNVIGTHPNYMFMAFAEKDKFNSDAIERLKYDFKYKWSLIYDDVYKKRVDEESMKLVHDSETTECFVGRTAQDAVKSMIAFAIEALKMMDKLFKEKKECFNV